MSLPQDILNSTTEEKLNYFYHYTIAHPVLLNADREMTRRLSMMSVEPIIFVVGPSGAGKTTMSKKIQQRILEASMSKMIADLDFLPVVWQEVPIYGNKVFKWAGFYKELLEALGNPLAAESVKRSPMDPDAKLVKNITEYNLQIALKKALRYRKTNPLLFDEANHFTKVSGAAALFQQMENIKSIANLNKCIIILFGTYELLSLWNLSGQLARRSHIIHLRRYDYNRNEDKADFADILSTFEQNLPLGVQPNLEKRLEFMWIGCAGIIGILKTWLYNCLHEVLVDKHKTISPDILKNHMPPKSMLKKIMEEVLIYERMFKDDLEGDYTSVAASMGIILDKDGNPINEKNDADNFPAKKRSIRARRVGERNPVRDKVGCIAKSAVA